MNKFSLVLLFSLCASTAEVGMADLFGSGANTFRIDFVEIGDPGNVADTTGVPNPAGAVPYAYRIGKFEVSEQMVNKANAQSALDGDPLALTIDSRGPDKPATSVSWFEAAQFVNWLNTSTGNTPAYKFDAQGAFQLWEDGDAGFDPNNLFRNSEAKYFLPSADEWYKSAFYDPVGDQWFDFPNGSDTAPLPVASGTDPNTAVWNQPFDQGPTDVMLAGGTSPFGTVGQAGNVIEWEESELDLLNDDANGLRGARGGTWIPTISDLDLSSSFRNQSLPDRDPSNGGFRVAAVIPEPSSFGLLVACLAICVFERR